MEHQYTQTGSLVRAILGASLSEAKTDNVGQPQCKSGASHPKKTFFFSTLSIAIFFSVLQGLKNILTIIEPHTSTRKYLAPLVDY